METAEKISQVEAAENVPIKPPFKRLVHGEEDSESNWLVSYADMMTLLFGFFVVISAFSKPDFSKVEKLKEETAKSMGKEYQKPYQSLATGLENTIKDSGLEKEVTITSTEEGVVIVSKGTLFFDSASTQLKEKAYGLTEKIADVLTQRSAKSTFRVTVEGHTDDNLMASKKFPSNWELSASRAATVVRLFEARGFPHANLRPAGLADTEPVVPNRDKDGKSIVENQSLNRRIVIRVHQLELDPPKEVDLHTPNEAKVPSPVSPVSVPTPADEAQAK